MGFFGIFEKQNEKRETEQNGVKMREIERMRDVN